MFSDKIKNTERIKMCIVKYLYDRQNIKRCLFRIQPGTIKLFGLTGEISVFFLKHFSTLLMMLSFNSRDHKLYIDYPNTCQKKKKKFILNIYI